ncbi:MAG: hypothetical protein IRY85_08405 [Micromonosporaceae bacterium]|nr:hypothetical protein [Micromonosporaceae bacterium]
MGDRDHIRWDDWDERTGPENGQGEHEWDPEDLVRAPTPGGTKTTALVMLAVFLATIVLCCVAAGEAGQLLWLELPPP